MGRLSSAAGDVVRGLADEAALASKLASDPRIKRVLAANLPRLEPALAARVQAGDPAAALEAYQQVVASGGRLPARQMELPLSDAPAGLIPFGVRGPGVPVGLSGPGVPRGLSGPGVRGGQMIPSQGMPLAVQGGRGLTPVDADFIPNGDMVVRSPDGSAMRGDVIPRRPVAEPYRTQGAPPRRGNRGAAAAAAGAGLVGLGYALRDTEESPSDGVTDTSGTAELHNEQSPAPSVEAPPEPTAEMYFSQARQLIDQLNQMRRNAGGEVPEAPQIMAQIKRLQALGDQLRNAPSYSPSDSGDPHQQAQMLIQDLNARRRQAGGEVPDAPRVMAEVRRLQAMGDQQKNSRYGRSGSFSQQYPKSA
jgi:hypothetical protein